MVNAHGERELAVGGVGMNECECGRNVAIVRARVELRANTRSQSRDPTRPKANAMMSYAFEPGWHDATAELKCDRNGRKYFDVEHHVPVRIVKNASATQQITRNIGRDIVWCSRQAGRHADNAYWYHQDAMHE